MILISILIDHLSGSLPDLILSLNSIENQHSNIYFSVEIFILINDKNTNLIKEYLYQRYPNQWFNNIQLVILEDLFNNYNVLDNEIEIFNDIKKNNKIYWKKYLKIANGEWICFLNTGDIWTNTKIDNQLSYLLSNENNDILYENDQWSSIIGTKQSLRSFLNK